MNKVLHIIQSLSNGGATRAMIAVAKYSMRQGPFVHHVAALAPGDPRVVDLLQRENIGYLGVLNHEQLAQAIEQYDLVHVNWWNSPEMQSWLKTDLPAMRLLAWFHVAGDKAPQIIGKNLIDFVDFALACSPYTYECPNLAALPDDIRLAKTGMALGATDFEKIEGIKTKAHSGFNVGYIGTVHYLKMHPHFAQMSARVNIPQVRFIVCGTGDVDQVKRDAGEHISKFDFRGQVEDIKSVIEELDVYGYPLCPDTYAAAELNIQEVMYAGLPVVAFRYGGLSLLIEHNQTGILVDSEDEYVQALEYLYQHPEERQRLGENAAEFARLYFGAENAAKTLNPIYEYMLQSPKKKRSWIEEYSSNELASLKQIAKNNPGSPALLGAIALLESLHDPQLVEVFTKNITTMDLGTLIHTDQQIMKMSALMASGGVGQYRRAYVNDPILHMWSGLCALGQGADQEALTHFYNTVNLGFKNWRTIWYVAYTSHKLGQNEVALDLLRQVTLAQPNFMPAHELLSQLERKPRHVQQ